MATLMKCPLALLPWDSRLPLGVAEDAIAPTIAATATDDRGTLWESVESST
jgi:hypothetical protein